MDTRDYDGNKQHQQQGAVVTKMQNTDLSVWLRSCMKEAKEPVEGVVASGE